VLRTQTLDSHPAPNNDSNGTVQLDGTFSSIEFTASYPGQDGIDIQIGADTAVTPEPGSLIMLFAGAIPLLAATLLKRRKRMSSEIRLDIKEYIHGNR
jgi:hypothetical protein